jgi:hypothetical protein
LKGLQRRLLAAQVDARVGWQEVQKLHLARMERMEAVMGGFNQREELLLTVGLGTCASWIQFTHSLKAPDFISWTYKVCV